MAVLLLSVLAAALVAYAFSGLAQLLYRQARSPLRRMDGPPPQSFFMGNLKDMHDMENNDLLARWEATYGTNFVYRGFVGGCRLMTTDPRAIAHILGNAYDYPKPDFVRDSLATMAAGHNGLLTVEGEQHRRQRKILNPAFSQTHIKSLSPIMWEKALKLRDIWTQTAKRTAQTGVPERTDALSWLSRATLDVIGLAGFGYTFNSLQDETNELARAFATIFSTARKFRVMTILQVWFPFLRRFRRNNATMVQATETMRRIGLELIEERKAAVAVEMVASGKEAGVAAIDGEQTILGRDILSVLIRSNMAAFDSKRMDVEEILCQISTFIAAGHETTSNALTWCLYALTQNPHVQSKLRAELRTLPALSSPSPTPATTTTTTTTTPTPNTEQLEEALSRLPYLDAVLRETLRVHAPITTTMRMCAKEEGDAVPVARPYRDREGVWRETIELKQHDIVSVPIQAINKSKAIWGEDANVFRPERWESTPEAAKDIPGLYSHTLSFLNGNPLNGNRACIGYKFAILEMKIFLFVLLRDLEFAMDERIVIEKKVNVVTRPFVKSDPDTGNQLPLYISIVPPSNSSIPALP